MSRAGVSTISTNPNLIFGQTRIKQHSTSEILCDGQIDRPACCTLVMVLDGYIRDHISK
jgi:hypothetical protein